MPLGREQCEKGSRSDDWDVLEGPQRQQIPVTAHDQVSPTGDRRLQHSIVIRTTRGGNPTRWLHDLRALDNLLHDLRHLGRLEQEPATQSRAH